MGLPARHLPSDDADVACILEGLHGAIEIRRGPAPDPVATPLLCAAETGYSALGGELSGWPSRAGDEVRKLADLMRASRSGPLVAVVRGPDGCRPMLLIHGNRSPWYRSHAPDPDGVWAPFYVAGVLALLQLAQEGGLSALEIAHPTGHEWLPGLADAVAQGLVLRPSPRTVFIHPCCAEHVPVFSQPAAHLPSPLQGVHVIERRQGVILARLQLAGA